jgi:hypothetical protein
VVAQALASLVLAALITACAARVAAGTWPDLACDGSNEPATYDQPPG